MNQILYYFSQIKIRFIRLLTHLVAPLTSKFRNDFHYQGFREWSGDLCCYLIDVIGMGEVYQLIFRTFKWNIRNLTHQEKMLLSPIFKDSINYDLICIDTQAKLGTKHLAMAYVSFNTINYRYPISSETLVHEAVHIWQYQNFGSIYLTRAIKAQRSVDGYYYGGEQGLYRAMNQNKPLIAFNFEQQADIIEDYYKIKNKLAVTSAIGNVTYEYYAQQLVF